MGVIVIGGGVTAVFVRGAFAPPVLALCWCACCRRNHELMVVRHLVGRWSSPCDCVGIGQSLMCDYGFPMSLIL